MLMQTIWGGLGLGALPVLLCAADIRKGAVGIRNCGIHACFTCREA